MIFCVYPLERIYKMKKSKILVPAVALLALGMAASTTATVAWFQATANATYSVANDSFAIAAQAYSESIGNVLFTASISEESVNCELSNAEGKTGYIVGGVVTEIDATENCYQVITVTITASKTAGDSTLTQLLVNLYNNATLAPSHNIAVRATPAGQALAKWVADSTPTSSELSSLYAGTLAAAADTNIALSSDGSVTSWTLYLAVADRAKYTNTTADQASDHSSDAVTVTPVAAA